MKINHIYKDILLKIEKPYRYIGGEPGSIVKSRDEVRCSMALAFPDVYEIGMSHMGFRILYQKINSASGFSAERVFAPWPDMESEMKTAGLQLVSLETSKPLKDFDFVGFSLQFELNYVNILQILDLGNIPLKSEDRTENDPIVLAGGPVATHAEPVAPFIDIIIPGDGEEITLEIMELNAKLKEQGVSRADRIKKIAENPHCYAPALYETEIDEETGFTVVVPPSGDKIPYPVTMAKISDFDAQPSPVEGPMAYDSVFERAAVELARGCNQGCRFCQAGYIYRPFTEHTPEYILKAVDKALELGHSEVSLSALSTLDYTDFEDLLDAVTSKLKTKTASVAVSSLRAYGLSDNLLTKLRTGRGGTLTFAPEAGTQRLRDIINKNVTEEELMETVEKVALKGWSGIKLYFMSGLPGETDDDLRAIPELGRRVYANTRKKIKGKAPRISCSVSNFVPKPHTPFQWFRVSDIDTMRKRKNIIYEASKRTGIKVRFHGARESRLEAVLAKGDRKLAEVILSAYKKGARFDGWRDMFNYYVWQDAFEETGIDLDPYVSELRPGCRLPWEHIDTGVSQKFLIKELEKSEKAITTEPCLVPSGKKISCNACGVPCNLPEEKEKKKHIIENLEKILLNSVKPDEVSSNGNPLNKKILIYYSKTGVGTIFSHLDSIDHFIRILRSASLELEYTEGFTPRPKMTFTPALGQFVEGENEILEVHVRSVPADKTKTLDLLNKNSLPGVVFSDIVESTGLPSLSKRIRSVSFKVVIPVTFVKENLIDELKNKIDKKEELIITRKSKSGKVKRFDIIPGIKRLDFNKTSENLEILLDIYEIPTSVVKPAEIAKLIGVAPENISEIRRLGFELKN